MSSANRYRHCPVIEIDGVKSLGTRKFRDHPQRPDDYFHTIREEDQIDLLAHKYYGDARYWWIIADYVGVSNPLQLPEPGTIIRIPHYKYAMMMIAGGVE